MTIVVTAKVTDGIILAADSAATFYGQDGMPVKIYNNANKIFNLVKVWPIGSMVYGSAGIGASSVETLTKNLRARLSNPHDPEYGLDRENYTVEEVATKARRYLYEECYLTAYPQPLANFFMGYQVCGYSAGAALPEVWQFAIVGPDCHPPYVIQSQQEFGMRWAGENEALDRLLLGTTSERSATCINTGRRPAQIAMTRIYGSECSQAYPRRRQGCSPSHWTTNRRRSEALILNSVTAGHPILA
jgi:hypothetical protein